ncbi:hypothetical protein Btru_075329 [Bulinus truncatus]|nr:hypothetical protein Btru_075329 [Bulinus truncatus]
MGRSCQNWMNQISHIAIVLICSAAFLLPYTSAYALHESDVDTFKNKRDEVENLTMNDLLAGRRAHNDIYKQVEELTMNDLLAGRESHNE